jgi:hypothetical protein
MSHAHSILPLQSKLQVMVQLLGRDNVGPLLLKMPAVLTVSLPRLVEVRQCPVTTLLKPC